MRIGPSPQRLRQEFSSSFSCALPLDVACRLTLFCCQFWCPGHAALRQRRRSSFKPRFRDLCGDADLSVCLLHSHNLPDAVHVQLASRAIELERETKRPFSLHFLVDDKEHAAWAEIASLAFDAALELHRDRRVHTIELSRRSSHRLFSCFLNEAVGFPRNANLRVVRASSMEGLPHSQIADSS